MAGANLSEYLPHLPPGSTAIAWKGELYLIDGETVKNSSGQVVDELPDDFPTVDDFKQRAKVKSFGGGGVTGAPLQQSMSPGESGSGRPQRTAASESGGEDFEAMTKDDLADLASQRDLTVKRGDGEDGEPLKEDYVKALKRHAKAQK